MKATFKITPALKEGLAGHRAVGRGAELGRDDGQRQILVDHLLAQGVPDLHARP